MNAALVLLAPPAAVWAMKSRWRTVGIAIVFAPIVVTLFLAFTSRPEIPLTAAGRWLQRTDGIEAAYAWIRSETPADAVIVGDPDRPLRMSGNVSEVPAFTGGTQLGREWCFDRALEARAGRRCRGGVSGQG